LPAVEVETITRLEDLAALHPEWVHLYERCPSATPFQHPEWLLPWWRHFGSGVLFCLGARTGGRLTGLAPAFLHTWRGRRQITLLGTGLSDRLGFLADPDREADVVPRMIGEFERMSSCWDVCDWDELPPGCAVVKAAEARGTIAPASMCTSIPLPPSMARLHETLPHGLQRSLRRYAEKLRVRGQVRFENHGSGAAFGQALSRFLELHSSRWAVAGERTVVDRAAQDFLRESLAGMARAGKARCLTLTIASAAAAPSELAIAAICGFLDKGRFWSYQSGFDPEWSRFSPGSLILEFAIGEAIREGARVFDFLRGEEPYKFAWGARSSSNLRLTLWPEWQG
jgi:CelD/BcsL family acetyltransferase involved in cellulose biosynthesis